MWLWGFDDRIVRSFCMVHGCEPRGRGKGIWRDDDDKDDGDNVRRGS